MSFIDIILETSQKQMTIEPTFSNYLLVVYANSKTPKLYGMERITTE